MGGKVWSEAEERHFWRVAISQSPKRAGIDLAKSEKPWEQLAKEMQNAMGDEARRQYSGTMLFEHYFQNIESQRRSPNAALFVREYLARRDLPRCGSKNHNRFNPYPLPPLYQRHRRNAACGNKPAVAIHCRNPSPIISDSLAIRPHVDPPRGIGFYNPTGIMESIETSPRMCLTASPSEDESLFVSTATDEESELGAGESCE
ncbi:hypothetical protein F4861DRAFT_539343 [Xylaria intraflava]|nr:hypothetical protein F4861DRAFT_539343 [Xylaria intraflava]